MQLGSGVQEQNLRKFWLFYILNSSKHGSGGSATVIFLFLDELIFTLLRVQGSEFGIPNRYTGFKIALDTAMDILCVTETKLDECFPDSQLKDTLSGLGQFWLTESPLKMMKNGFYFTLKAFFVLKIIFWSYRKTIWLERSGCFQIYDVTSWLTNSCNTHVTQYLKR